MGRLGEGFGALVNNRWLVFVAAMWIQSCAGIGYLFGSISPVIKSSLSYNQRQVARLGVAKDLGDSVGFLAGSLCEVLPMWGALLVGALQNFVGYGWVWLVVTGRVPTLPLWAMCVLIFIGTNGETYFNTAALVSCVQNFPKSRGPVVGILKGFAGLGGAILTQIYAVIHSPDHANLIFMIAVGPTMVIIALMFIVRPVGGHRQVRPSDGRSFTFIYSVCLLLAAYLMGVMLVEDLVDLNQTVIMIFTAILFVLLLLPIVVPVSLTFLSDSRAPLQEPLLPAPQKQEASKSEQDGHEVIFSEVEEEKPKEVDLLPASERQKRIAQLQSKLFQAAAEGAVRVKRRKGPHRGEDFTLAQALIKADFWLIFFSLLLGSGSGLTVIDNLGQMSQSLGYDNAHIFATPHHNTSLSLRAMGDMATLHRSLPTVALLFLLLLSTAASGEDDSSAMSELRAAMSPAPSGWSSATAYCKWDGVECDSSSRVTGIDLASRSLTGTLPADLSSLSRLKTLSLQKNAFSGPIPNLANLASLQDIYLDSNNFTNVPDGAFAGLISLQTLSLSNNFNLEPWVIPSELNQSTGLVTFYAGNANLMGRLPDFFGSFPSLQSLRLSYNNLTGALPPSFAGSGIKNLWLNNQAQGLSGTIDVLSSMPQLYQVWLHKNRFTGPIPDLSKCESLFDLQLRDNEFTGVVPANLMSLPSIKNVSLDSNKLQGPVPDNPNNIKFTYDGTNSFCNTAPGPCAPQVTTLLEIAGALGYPMTLAESWEGNDACQGWSFIICQGKNVTSVSFSKQQFSGTISPAFANLTSLRSLLLNDNDLTGSIPQSLATLPHLQVLDVSNNNLSGAVPVFPASVKLTSTGNPLLGKSSDGSGGTPGSDSTSGNSSSAAKGSVSAGLIVALVFAGLVFLAVVLFVLYKFCYAKRKNTGFRMGESLEKGKEVAKINGMNGYGGIQSEMHSQSSGDLPVFDGGNVAISIDVLREVTDDFSEGNVLGRGGFGVVYKGELHDGTMIAVKRMESLDLGNKGLSEFQAELAVLTKVRHRHLVALLGYCINGNERLLVYEHMPQGTLAQHLFEWEEMGCLPLTWKQRVTIALDVARGVEYLHSLAQQSFIHRDLKPSNILLGDDMRAKVADFGLVKNAPDGKYSLETRLAGTFGYLAPEYAATGRVTTKVDIYAYGVVLMEILTGRKALDDSLPDESAHLVTWFRRVLINKENIPKAIDQTLNPDNDTLESICKVAELAGHCTAREPSQRPDMGHAVNVLSPLVEQWKPSRQEEEDNYGIDLHMSLPQALERWQSDEGTSSMFDGASFSQTQSSIPSKPASFVDAFNSADCR